MDVERVGPGLHEAGGGHRRGRHRRAVPGHLLPLGVVAERLGEPGARRTPAGEQGRRCGQPALERRSVDGVLGVGHRLEDQSVPARLVGRGGVGRLVGPGQVGDLGRDVPAGRRGRACASAASGRPTTSDSSRSPSPARSARTPSSTAFTSGPPSRVRAHWSRIRLRRRVSSVIVRGQAEPADQVEGGLDELAHAGPGLVGAEQVDGHPVGLATDLLLQRGHGGRRVASVRAATHSSSAAMKTGDAKWSPSIRSTSRVRCGAVGYGGGSGRELGAADLGQVLDRGDHQVVLGREVVQLRPARHPGPLADQRRRGAARTRARPGTRWWRPSAARASRATAPPAARAPWSPPAHAPVVQTNSQACLFVGRLPGSP